MTRERAEELTRMEREAFVADRDAAGITPDDFMEDLFVIYPQPRMEQFKAEYAAELVALQEMRDRWIESEESRGQ